MNIKLTPFFMKCIVWSSSLSASIAATSSVQPSSSAVATSVLLLSCSVAQLPSCSHNTRSGQVVINGGQWCSLVGWPEVMANGVNVCRFCLEVCYTLVLRLVDTSLARELIKDYVSKVTNHQSKAKYKLTIDTQSPVTEWRPVKLWF